MTGIGSDSEQEWIERRAAKIARETGSTLAAARSAALAQLFLLRYRPKAEIIELSNWMLRRADNAAKSAHSPDPVKSE